jgi:uncharacterized protein
MPTESGDPVYAEGALIPIAAIRVREAAPPGRPARRNLELLAASQPLLPDAHRFEARGQPHLYLPQGSRVYSLETEAATGMSAMLASRNGEALRAYLSELGLSDHTYVDDAPVQSPPVRALSLAVAQKCNLGCTYCYAQEGGFGSAPKSMPREKALEAVDLLLETAGRGDRVNLAFLGGEPLTNRAVVRSATEHAAAAARKGATVTFSITTNGTLVTEEDGEFFERHAFAVTVSIDGVGEAHNRLRSFKGGSGSYARILTRVKPLLERQRRMQVSARATVTPANLRLRETLDGLIALGFHSVGFSPMLSSPTGRGEMGGGDLETMLEQMVECGEEFERRVIAGRRYPFLNLATALREIHRGTHRPYPCGAGAGYFGVSAEGGLYACHRFVEDEEGAMGSVSAGVDSGRQNDWLASRHVHRQEPCRSCWARYLCGGGCHHEVIRRGRPACDYIRGWLHYCLQAYARLSEQRPDYFASSLG